MLPTHLPTYVEPFGGMASVLLNREPTEVEVYNDIDPGLYGLMSTLASEPGSILDDMRLTPYSRSEFDLAYATLDDDPVRCMIVRSQQAVMRVTRKTKSGWSRNVTASTRVVDAWAGIPSTLRRMAKRLRDVVVTNENALEVIAEYDSPDTLFYLDPPYTMDARTGGVGYRSEVDDDFHRKLAEHASCLLGHVAISGYRSELYDQLFPAPKWTRYDSAKRHSDRLKATRAPRVESLWVNYSV